MVRTATNCFLLYVSTKFAILSKDLSASFLLFTKMSLTETVVPRMCTSPGVLQVIHLSIDTYILIVYIHMYSVHLCMWTEFINCFRARFRR